MPGLSHHYQSALNAAFSLYGGDERKGDKTPYFGHLLAVSSLVMEHGGDEEVAIAALFHDALEDKDDSRGIVRCYGARVLQIVLECSDTQVRPKPPWRERKEKKLASLPYLLTESRLVLAADNLHNLRSLNTALGQKHLQAFDVFNVGVDDKWWQVCSMAERLRDLDQNRLTQLLWKEFLEFDTALGWFRGKDT